MDFAQMLDDAGGADRFAALGADTQQHAILHVQRDQLPQRRGHLDGMGLLLLSHAGIDVLRRFAPWRGLALKPGWAPCLVGAGTGPLAYFLIQKIPG